MPNMQLIWCSFFIVCISMSLADCKKKEKENATVVYSNPKADFVNDNDT